MAMTKHPALSIIMPLLHTTLLLLITTLSSARARQASTKSQTALATAHEHSEQVISTRLKLTSTPVSKALRMRASSSGGHFSSCFAGRRFYRGAEGRQVSALFPSRRVSHELGCDCRQLEAIDGQGQGAMGKLTDDDIAKIAGKREQLEGALQEKYGYGKDKASPKSIADQDPQMSSRKRGWSTIALSFRC